MPGIPAHLPHRYPFLLLDRVLEREPGVRVVAEKLVPASEPCLRGQEAPQVPGTLLLEMLAQAGGFLEAEPLHGGGIFLAGVPEARFKAPARAGDRLRLEVRAEGAFSGLLKVKGTVRCDDRELCAASLVVKRL